MVCKWNYSNTNTNLSRSISFSLLDRIGNEIPIETKNDSLIELIIPRDPSVVIPPMSLQNITSMIPFNLHYVSLMQSGNNLSISLHFQMHPLNSSLAYLLIYKFDSSPQLNGSNNRVDDWTFFCPADLTNDSLYEYFINNRQTTGYQAMIFGIRELNSSEITTFCSNRLIVSVPITNQLNVFLFIELYSSVIFSFYPIRSIGIMFSPVLILFAIEQFI